MMTSSLPATRWWQDTTVYQIYPRSFQDSNGDGIGDIPGIISRLGHLADLGIGVIWLSPIFASPMADNGYDISDYQAIAPEYGTLEDFDRLVMEARARGIGILLDLVVNHTSDQHAWFQSARSARDAEKRDFYVWRDPAPGGGPPNDLQSSFGGPAWTFDDATGQYYLHQFAPGQPDLNWQNPAVRRAVYDMMNWWLDRGIAGFRMDVIDLIGKDVDAGITADGPNLHVYLKEMNRETFGTRNVLTVGEAWSATPEAALLYSGRDRAELSMVFQFEHVTRQWDEIHGKWQPKPFNLVALKCVFDKWQYAFADDGWNALFWGNHDLPRAVSKYGDDGEYRERSAKMLATVLHLMKGTPFVYQGEEIGMTNMRFTDPGQIKDIEARNFFRLQTAAGRSVAEFLEGANANARDNSRTPMQWDATTNAGFTTGSTWIEVNPNHDRINVDQARREQQSVLEHYKRLIALRKAHPIIVHGRYESHLSDHPACIAYTRMLDRKRLVVIANFFAEEIEVDLPRAMQGSGACLVHNVVNRKMLGQTVNLTPYEAFAILMPGSIGP